MKLSMKESEMDELKSELELRKSSSHKKSPTAAVENLKKELQSVVERNKAGMTTWLYVVSIYFLLSMLWVNVYFFYKLSKVYNLLLNKSRK